MTSFDFELDSMCRSQEPTDRQSLVVKRAQEACFSWWISAKPARRDTVERAFRLTRLRWEERESFRLAWIAEFRRLECSEPEMPEEFFR